MNKQEKIFIGLISILLMMCIYAIYNNSLWIEVGGCYNDNFEEIQKQHIIRCKGFKHCGIEVELKQFGCLIRKIKK